MTKNALHTPVAHATWLTLVALAGVALAGVLLTPERTGPTDAAWFMFPVLWLMFAVPGAVLLHGHALTAGGDVSDQAAPASPVGDTSLTAARSVWGVLTLGVVLSLVAARVSGAVSPSVWPGAVMFMLLMLARPGRAA